MPDPRVAFFGTPEFALPTLKALIASPYRPVVVVTQPDRPAGRGRRLREPPLKSVAEAAEIPLLQPPRIHDAAATAALAAYEPELQIVVAYGQILRPDVLALPRYGNLNVHPSLLPRWRGAAPIVAALRVGDRESGVTILALDEGEDSGPILATRREPIHEDDDSGTLGARLAALGAESLLATIPAWLEGTISPQPQDETQVTRAPRIRKEDCWIDWSQPASTIWRQVRALSPQPGARTALGGADLLVWRAHPETGGAGRPGTVLAAGDTIAVRAGEGILHLEQVQRAGRRALSARAFASGERGLVGVRLGASGVSQESSGRAE